MLSGENVAYDVGFLDIPTKVHSVAYILRNLAFSAMYSFDRGEIRASQPLSRHGHGFCTPVRVPEQLNQNFYMILEANKLTNL